MGMLDGTPVMYDLAVPIGQRNGHVVLVSWKVPRQMTEAEWQQMLSILEAMKPGLVANPGLIINELDPPRANVTGWRE